MVNLNMNKNEIVKLFNKYNLNTLESIDVLLSYVKEYNLDDTNVAYKRVYQEKYEESRNVFESMNEYDFINKLINFDLIEVMDNAGSLSEKEIIFLQKIIEDSLKNIVNRTELEGNVISKLVDCKNVITDQLVLSEEYEVDKLSDVEIEKLFNKYSINELDVLGSVFKYVKDYDLSNTLKIAEKIYNKKYEECVNNYEVLTENYRAIDIANKNHLLSAKELKYLHTLVDNASFYLLEIRSDAYEYEDVIDDFDVNSYPVKFMFDFEQSLKMEIENRKQSHKVKVKMKH